MKKLNKTLSIIIIEIYIVPQLNRKQTFEHKNQCIKSHITKAKFREKYYYRERKKKLLFVFLYYCTNFLY